MILCGHLCKPRSSTHMDALIQRQIRDKIWPLEDVNETKRFAPRAS